jgi:hypothetical protein
MEDKDKACDLKYRKGCLACEHSDPELERELQAFAQLLFDIYIDKKKRKNDQKSDGELEEKTSHEVR